MTIRREFVLVLAVCLGCTGPAIRSQSPELDLIDATDVTLVGDMCRPFGMDYVQVEAVDLVTGLDGTGDDPAPSPRRAVLLGEMQTQKVTHAAQVLASPDTALVLVRGWLRPGIQKGDRFDVEVRVPSRSETESLRGGWLLDTRLTPLAVLGKQIRKGQELAIARGPVLVDPSSQDDSTRVHRTRGRVLGGGVALKSRKLGLILHGQSRSISASQYVGKALNGRFHSYVRGVKQGVAKPKTDEFVELIVHPRYKDNVTRYMRVVRNVSVGERPADRQTRLRLLERQLLDPVTTATAAVRLEAIGREAVEILKTGIVAADPEVRFYAAEALAYLDHTEAAEPLAAAVRDQPAFRIHALAALSAMDDLAAQDQLRRLLSAQSAETRYGAFRALWKMNPKDLQVRGEQLSGQFSYHVLDVDGPPMIHVTRSLRPEIVLFGGQHQLATPVVLEAGKNILVNARSPDQVAVSRFEVGRPDQQRLVSNDIDAVVRAIVELQGSYPDVVQALQQAKDQGMLPSRFKVDALPRQGRPYERQVASQDGDGEAGRPTPAFPKLLRPLTKRGRGG